MIFFHSLGSPTDVKHPVGGAEAMVAPTIKRSGIVYADYLPNTHAHVRIRAFLYYKQRAYTYASLFMLYGILCFLSLKTPKKACFCKMRIYSTL